LETKHFTGLIPFPQKISGGNGAVCRAFNRAFHEKFHLPQGRFQKSASTRRLTFDFKSGAVCLICFCD
jgi:hypothetical protein